MAGENYTHDQDVWMIPTQRQAMSPANDATMVLPIYAPSGVPAATPAPVGTTPTPTQGRKPDALPADERNMLIFVSALLALGTLAIVAMASVGR